MSLHYAKMQGAGNDFIVTEETGHDWSSLAPELCARRVGVGADGILVAQRSDVADVRMRMYNPDGTEDHCGNGIRCLALYAFRRGLVSGPEFHVETLAGVKPVRVHGAEGHETLVTAEMGRADLSPGAVPALFTAPALGVPLEVGGRTLEVHSLSTGTAHTVLFHVPDEAEFTRLSPLIEHHPSYPERTSVLWAGVEARDRVRVRIWERGAGETLACGTGACAVAVASCLSGRTGPVVRVVSRGGALTVEVADDLSLRMTGPAAFVFDGWWPTRP